MTRGQLAKIDVVAARLAADQSGRGHLRRRAAGHAPSTRSWRRPSCHGIISGYTCGGPGEPCDAEHRPYFRRAADATRGQIAKIVYGALTSAATCAAP